MINNNQKNQEKYFSINPLYIEKRVAMIEIIQMINTALDNNSQTFFLCLYYIDIIFSNDNFEKVFRLFYGDQEEVLNIEININNLLMMSLTCLIIATKYNENDPHVPNIISFINLCSYYSYNKYNYEVRDLSKAEVIIIKVLNYKLNYFTLYHFFNFFFAHGFLFECILEEKAKENEFNKNEILEKIYIESREIMDKLIEDNECINYILGNNTCLTAIQLLVFTTKIIINIDLLKEENNIFKLIYNINYENKKLNEILENKIQNIYDNIIKNNSNNNSEEQKIKSQNKINLVIKTINFDKQEKYLTNETTEDKLNIINNNNMFISSDQYFLEKYKTKIFKNEKINKNRNINENNHMAFFISKIKYLHKKNKNKSNSTKNFRYKQLFKSKNYKNMNLFKYNKYNLLNKRNIEEKKANENSDEKEIQLNLEDNLQNKIIRNSYSLSSYNKNIYNNNNQIRNLFNNYNKYNLLNLNYRYDDNCEFQDSININNEFFDSKNYFNKIFIYDENNIIRNTNEKKYREKTYKSSLILDKLNFIYTGINNTYNTNDNINSENKGYNNYNNSTLLNYKYDNNINEKNGKENLLDNNNKNDSTNFNKYKNFLKTRIFENDILNSYNIDESNLNYRKKENENNNFLSYGTYYQYGKLNKYEYIDKFSKGIKKKEYIPIKLKSRNNYGLYFY